MKAKKTINLDFFQITSDAKSKEERDEKTDAIRTAISNLVRLDKTKPLVHSENQVCLFGNIERRSTLLFGTLVKSQMSEIPPMFDVKTRVLTPLSMDESEGLAYSTCFLFDPSMNMLMIESIPNGVSASAFCGFLKANLDIPSISPAIVINPADMQRFMRMGIITEFRVKVARLENGSIFTNPKPSISKMMGTADETNALILDCKLQAKKKGHTLSIQRIKQLVTEFVSYKETEEVQDLLVVGKESEEESLFPIDFIKQRMRDKIQVERQRLIGSFSISERFGLMDEIYARHRPALVDIYRIP